MVIKQLSVFLENKEGRLESVTQALCKEDINIASFSLADTSEFGLLRMIVSDPEKAKKILKDMGFSAKLTNVIAVKIAQKPGTLHEVLKLLFEAGLSVEYMYTLATKGKNTSVIMKLSDLDQALKVLDTSGYEVCTAKEAYEINNCVDK